MTASPTPDESAGGAGRVIIAGYGDVGARVARGWTAPLPLVAVNRTGRWAEMARPPAMEVTDLAWLGRLLTPADRLLWLAPPPAQGESDTILAAALGPVARLQRLVYLSTSGVYGDCQGAWVTEEAPRRPQTPRACRRAHAEAVVQAFGQRSETPVAIVRVPGIYGPGRLPLRRIEKGLPTLAAAISPWSNRVHVEDLAALLRRLLEDGEGVFNISDGQPGTITEYFHAVADVLDLPRLPEVDDPADLTPELASYMRESRRLDISRVRQKYGFAPRFTDLRAALPACRTDDLRWRPSADSLG